MVLLEEKDDPPWEHVQRRVPAAETGATIEFCTALPPNKPLQGSLNSGVAAVSAP
jgi:hypothetical protein